jgi:hypothetical protein
VKMEEQVSQILKESEEKRRVFQMMLKIRVMSMFTDVMFTFSTCYLSRRVYFSRAFHFLGL